MSEAYPGYDGCAGSLGPCDRIAALRSCLEETEDVKNALRARVAELEGERDALRVEALGMREALEAVRSCPGYFYPDTGVEGVYAEVVTCEECGGGSNGCESYIAAQALASSPLTAAAAERVAKMERVCEAARDIFRDRSGQVEIAAAGMNRMLTLKVALVALDVKGEE